MCDGVVSMCEITVISTKLTKRRFVKIFLLKTPNLSKTMESTTTEAYQLEEVQKSHFHVNRDKLSCDEAGRKTSPVPRRLRLRNTLDQRFGVQDPRVLLTVRGRSAYPGQRDTTKSAEDDA